MKDLDETLRELGKNVESFKTIKKNIGGRNEKMGMTIEDYAREIINNLGEKYGLVSIEGNDPDTYHGKYQGYGFEIEARYDDETFTTGKLTIKFNWKIVYTTYKGIIYYGTWQTVLKELYENIPNIIRDKEEQEKRALHIRNLYSTYIKPFWGRASKISDSTRLGSYKVPKKNAGYWDEKEDTHYTVLYNNDIVLDTVNDDIYKYVPGEWEQDIISFYNKNKYLINHETDSERRDAEKQLIKIKTFKKGNL